MLELNAGEAALLALPLAVVLASLCALVLLSRRTARLTARVEHLEQQRPVGAGDLAVLRGDLAQALRHVAVVR
ncbi:MAG: DUF4446 domain-containing protein, partial [Ornithinibacter sp.]